jgi:hypothetical protein
MKLSRVGKAPSAFWPGRDTGACELPGWAGATPSHCRVLACSGWARKCRGTSACRGSAYQCRASGKVGSVLGSDPSRDTREFLRVEGG